MGVQLSVPGLYLPPVLSIWVTAPDDHFAPGPHCRVKASAGGRAVVLVGVQLSVMGLYRPPVFKKVPPYPPQTIISLPVQTAV